MSEKDQTILDFGAIDFTPEWARKSAGVTVTAGSGAAAREQRDFTKSPRKDFPRRGGVKKPFGGRMDKDRPRPAERIRPLDAEVKILPETKALGTIIRKLQQDTYHIMQAMAGIHPGDPTYNTDLDPANYRKTM